MSAPTILLTGGMGYIGSHTCVELQNAGFDVLILDNLCNSHPRVLERIAAITGQRAEFIHGDLRDQHLLEQLFSKHKIDAVIHFAGLKAVGESATMPLEYYDNNVSGSLCLLAAMRAAAVNTLVFSSSATVYGEPQHLPLDEDHPLSATNPYARCKLMIEEILRDFKVSAPHWRIAILRYFNPVGAHVSGLIGEDPRDTPNNLMPYIAQVAVGRREKLQVFGGDYPTADGTGVRDYLHVVDLAGGHLRALQTLTEIEDEGDGKLLTVNLGTGRGYSVLDMVQAFETTASRPVPYEIVARRPGDVPVCYADPQRAANLLQWRAERDLHAMCQDTWRWQSQNPNGYA